MNTPQTFDSSDAVLTYLQSIYGSANFNSWQSLRKTWYSYVTYPVAGQTQTSFFGNVAGQTGVTIQDTNMTKAGSFGQTHFLLMGIRMDIRPKADFQLNRAMTADADALFSDLYLGLAQAGVLQINIGARPFIQLPNPFLYAPPADGRPVLRWNGARSGALPTQVSSNPHAELNNDIDNLYRVDPMVLIEAEQGFDVSLLYPTNPAPSVIATNIITNDTTACLQVGVSLEGIMYRPVQ